MARPTRLATATVAALAASALVGCAQARPLPTYTPTFTTASPGASAAPSTPAAPTCAEAAARLGVAERAGAVVLVGLAGAPDAAATARLARTHAGGVLMTGSFRTGVGGVKAITGPLAASGLLVAVVQEGGARQTLSGAGFDTIPAAADQARQDATGLRASWVVWGRQLADAGVTLDLAPAGDVLSAANLTRGMPAGSWSRLYGSDAAAVASAVGSAVAGLEQSKVAAAASHYPGMGALASGADTTDTAPATDTASGPGAGDAPYRAAAAAGASGITISTATFAKVDPSAPAVFSAKVMAAARDGLRFGGVLISDDMASPSLAATPPDQRLVRFIAAGGDLGVVSDPALAEAAINALAAAAASDPALATRLTDAAANTLGLKAKAGLASCLAVKG